MVGQNIRERREHLGLTQQQLAERVAVDISTISKIETSSANPSLKIFFKLASALNITPEELMKPKTSWQ